MKSKADKIRWIADKYGSHHGNQFIKGKVYEEFGENVSDNQIVNTLGNSEYRTRVLDESIGRAARTLSLACDHDKRLIYRAVNKWCS